MTQQASTRHGVVLILAGVMPTMAVVALIPVLPLLIQEFAQVSGASVLVPMAITIPALSVALFSPVAGWLADRLGRRLLLIASLIGYTIVGLLPIALTDLHQILVARVLLGFAEAMIMTVSTTLIGDYFAGERRERWVAIQIAVASVSAIVLIALGGALGEVFGSRGPFWLYVLALPVALACAIILFEPARTVRAAAPTGYARGIVGLVAITFAITLLFYTVIVQLGPLIAATGVTSPAVIGLAGAAANLGVTVGSILFGRLKARSGEQLLSTGLPLVAIGYIGIALSAEFYLTVAAAIVICIGSGLMLPTMLAWVLRRLPPETRGRGTGLWTGAFFLAQFVAPVAAAALSGVFGGLPNVFLLFAAVAATGAGAAFCCRSTPSHSAKAAL